MRYFGIRWPVFVRVSELGLDCGSVTRRFARGLSVNLSSALAKETGQADVVTSRRPRRFRRRPSKRWTRSPRWQCAAGRPTVTTSWTDVRLLARVFGAPCLGVWRRRPTKSFRGARASPLRGAAGHPTDMLPSTTGVNDKATLHSLGSTLFAAPGGASLPASVPTVTVAVSVGAEA